MPAALLFPSLPLARKPQVCKLHYTTGPIPFSILQDAGRPPPLPVPSSSSSSSSRMPWRRILLAAGIKAPRPLADRDSWPINRRNNVAPFGNSARWLGPSEEVTGGGEAFRQLPGGGAASVAGGLPFSPTEDGFGVRPGQRRLPQTTNRAAARASGEQPGRGVFEKPQTDGIARIISNMPRISGRGFGCIAVLPDVPSSTVRPCNRNVDCAVGSLSRTRLVLVVQLIHMQRYGWLLEPSRSVLWSGSTSQKTNLQCHFCLLPDIYM